MAKEITRKPSIHTFPTHWIKENMKIISGEELGFHLLNVAREKGSHEGHIKR